MENNDSPRQNDDIVDVTLGKVWNTVDCGFKWLYQQSGSVHVSEMTNVLKKNKLESYERMNGSKRQTDGNIYCYDNGISCTFGWAPLSQVKEKTPEMYEYLRQTALKQK